MALGGTAQAAKPTTSGFGRFATGARWWPDLEVLCHLRRAMAGSRCLPTFRSPGEEGLEHQLAAEKDPE
eukprot:4834438-Amphidinium_carterae.1